MHFSYRMCLFVVLPVVKDDSYILQNLQENERRPIGKATSRLETAL
jgi:hypothetical protein